MQGPLEKVEEELAELKVEILKLESLSKNEDDQGFRKRVEDEMGDLLFTLCNISYLMKINPEAALRGTLERFQKRFRHVEKRLKQKGKTPEQSDLKEMDQYWDEAKRLEKVEIWGLTGGIASGKSAAGHIFTQCGIPVVYADQIAKDLTQDGTPVQQEIEEKFGTSDRKRLREIIYSNPKAKEDLEAILHPLIQIESLRRIEALAAQHSLIVYEAALLVEKGRAQDFTGLITVEAPREIRINRLQKRDSISTQEAERILAAQVSDEERRKHSNFILNNSGTIEELKAQIREFLRQRKNKVV
jgi:dephospho-CoA kinase